MPHNDGGHDHEESGLVDYALLANFTHQIINPLNGVLGTLHNIIDGTVSPERRPQRLKAVYGQLGVTVELVRNLAFLSQLSTQAGRESMKELAAEVILPRTIIEAAQFFQETADEKKKMRIFLKNREDRYLVLGHAPLLRQVFMNLFENGIKYGDPDTHITIEMRNQFRKGRLLVEVRGKGSGFDADESERMFELGFRGRHAKSVLASGSGLGLFICRQILDLYDAKITADCSQRTRDVFFRIYFPTYRLDSEERRKDVDDE